MKKFYINGEEVRSTEFWNKARYITPKQMENLRNGKTVKKGNKEFRIEERR